MLTIYVTFQKQLNNIQFQITHWVPKNCEEQIVRVFLKPSESDSQGDNQKCEKLRTAFHAWFRETIPEVSFALFCSS